MRNKDNYDERQIIERGKAFQIGFMTAIVLSLVTFLVTGLFDIRISAMTVFGIQTTIPIMVCMMAMILKNAYDPMNKRVAPILCGIFSVLGLYLVLFSVGRVLLGQDSFLEGGAVTDTSGFIVVGLSMIGTGIVYLIRKRRNKKELTED